MATDEPHYAAYEPAAVIEAEPPAAVVTAAPAPSAPAEPAAWLLWPVRVVAFCVVLPVRLVWEALRGAARAVGSAVENLLGRAFAAAVLVVVTAVTAVLAPLRWIGRRLIGSLAAARRAVLAGLARLVQQLVLPVARAIGGALRALASGLLAACTTPLRIVLGALGAVLAWLTRRLVLPVLRAIGAAARGVGRRVAAVWSALAGAAVAALRAVGGAAVAVILLGARGLALLGRSAGRTVRRMVERLVVRPVIALLGLMAAGARLLGRALVAPVALLWRRGLRPAGSAIAIAAVAAVMGAWRFLVRPLARGIGQALGWAWHTSGRVLAFTGRVLAWPFVWLYRHVLTPVGHVLRSAWRAAVLAPWRAVRRTTAGVVAAVRTAVRDARRQAGNQVRSALGRPPR